MLYLCKKNDLTVSSSRPSFLPYSKKILKFSKLIFFNSNFFTIIKNCYLWTSILPRKCYQVNYSKCSLHILIAQIDAYTFSDDLIKWCEKDFHYIGATCFKFKNYWTSEFIFCGVGGFSLRNIKKTLGILDETNERADEETGVVLVDGDSVPYRATFLIDEEGMVFHEGVNHMPIGRNVAEYLRLIDAFTHVQVKGEVCPANWEEGKDAMNANRDGVASYLSSH